MATAANNKRTPLRRATTSRGRVGSGRSARPAEADARATAPTLAVGIGGAIAALGILLARDYLFAPAEAPGTLTVDEPSTAPAGKKRDVAVAPDPQVALFGGGAVLSVAAAIAATQKKGGVEVGSEATGDDAAKAAIGTEPSATGRRV